MARKAGKIWREHGALLYIEGVADDVKPGKLHVVPAEREAQGRRDRGHSRGSSSRSVRTRDKVNAKVMKDPRMANMMDPKAMPFDGKRHDLRRLQGDG